MSVGASISRRHLIASMATLAGLTLAPPTLLRRGARAAVLPASAGALRLEAKAAHARLVGDAYPATPVWCFNDSVPGPLIRHRQGDRLDVTLANSLPEATTIHWHGVRLPNAMDGVPHLTQPPVGPGESFAYSFELPDAGTFWYHPHSRSYEQVDRGLAGVLIVEEPEPPQVDRELLWVLDDWRLTGEAAVHDSFANMHDLAHAGRIGNTVTINGILPTEAPVRSGERVRLRLVNVANARIFGIKFASHSPEIIAIDGQPCTPHTAAGGLIVLPPGGRSDLILDMTGQPGDRFLVSDAYYANREYRLLDLVYEEATPLRESLLDAPTALPPNPLAAPDLNSAESLVLTLDGGMGRPGAHRMTPSGGIPTLWLINGHAGMPDHNERPLFSLKRGASYRLLVENLSRFDHPMHLHGHHMRLLSRNGVPVSQEIWHDTALAGPEERLELAFVADNPGNWMLHCHVLEHQAAGMMGHIEIA